MSSTELGHSHHGIPDVVMQQIDRYVDSLASQIQPRIASELDVFQQKTIDSLDEQVAGAFRSLFNKDRNRSGSDSSGDRQNDSPPNVYGRQSVPFADEIAKLTRSLNKVTDGAGDDLREIFDLTEGGHSDSVQIRARGGANNQDSFSHVGARGFFSAALNAVQDHLDSTERLGGSSPQLDGVLGVLSSTLKEASRNPEEKARLISPEIKERVGAKLREKHAPIAEQFTHIALDHIKRWLRGNTTTRDLGDGVKGEIQDQVKDLVKGFGSLLSRHKGDHSESGNSREVGDHFENEGGLEDRARGGGGFSRIISDKLSTGLARVHREVRLEFRGVLGEIEKQLFELLPDEFQRPLEKLLGGNPFEPQLDHEIQPDSNRGDFADDIKIKILEKIRALVQKVQASLRTSILGVISGGHRKFELQSWVFVQNMVEMKVQKYLPQVKITVPDDIGNEGVSVGAPALQFGNHSQSVPLPSAPNSYPTYSYHQDDGQARYPQEQSDPAHYQYLQEHQRNQYQRYQ